MIRNFLKDQANKVLAKGAEMASGKKPPEQEQIQEEEKPAVWQRPDETLANLRTMISYFSDHMKRQGKNFDTSSLDNLVTAASGLAQVVKDKARPSISDRRSFLQLDALAHSLKLKVNDQKKATTSDDLKEIARDVEMAGKTLANSGFPPPKTEENDAGAPTI